jgi:hypothetical protein
VRIAERGIVVGLVAAHRLAIGVKREGDAARPPVGGGTRG